MSFGKPQVGRYKVQTRMFAMLAVLALCLTSLSYGQAVAVAQVEGQVTDPTGSVIGDAEVRMTQTITGYTRTIKTDAGGHYSLPSLPTGPYSLEVKASGFKTYTQKDIVLQVGTNIQINAALQVGAVSENVEVTASAGMVETRDNAVAQVINERQINDLPLNGRQATQLVLISGASAPTPADSLNSTKNYTSSVRSRSLADRATTNYLLDGGDNNDTFSNVNLPFPFPGRAAGIQRRDQRAARALRHCTPARRSTSSPSPARTRSHGDLFDYLRNGDLNARNYFAATQDTPEAQPVRRRVRRQDHSG